MADQGRPRLVSLVRVLLLGFVAVSLAWIAFSQLRSRESGPEEALPAEPPGVARSVPTAQVVVYFFHPRRRCASCETIGAYASAAIREGFEAQLQDGTLVWRDVDYEAPASAGYVARYGLFTSAVVLVEMRQGRAGRWKNLEDVWYLLGDRQRFSDYVQRETASFLSPESERTAH